MAGPGAGPMAATKEGSDSNSPAQPPPPPPPTHPAPSSSTTAPSPSSQLLFHCRLDFLLPSFVSSGNARKCRSRAVTEINPHRLISAAREDVCVGRRVD